MKIFLIFLISYLTGAIPAGYIIGKHFYHIDITKYGSGNIGTANVQRVLGNKAAIMRLYLIPQKELFLRLLLFMS